MAESIEKAIEKLNSKLQGAVIKRLDDVSLNVKYVPSGILMLDRLCGGSGIPLGRITEFFGPEGGGKTTLACLVAASWQRQGKNVAYIDMEHRMDNIWMGKLGLNPAKTYIVRPDSGTSGLQALDAMVDSDVFDLIIFDSVAAIVAESETEKDITKQEVSIVARLLGDVIRRLNPKLSKTNTSVIFINQVRSKVGVMFGCVNGETLINFTDGRALPIKQVVEQKIKGKVWSYNEQTNKIEAKPITAWYDNGLVEKPSDWVSITTVGFGINGVSSITVTPDHQVLTTKGWKVAKDITKKDNLITKYNSYINGTLKNFLYGACIGDSYLHVRSKNTACLKLRDNLNDTYAQWKAKLIAPYLPTHASKTAKYTQYITPYRHDLAILKHKIQDRNPLAVLDADFTALSLAIWYMDDGNFDDSDGHCRSCISVKRFASKSSVLRQITKKLKELFGLECTVSKKGGSLIFNVDNTRKLHKLIAKYVPDCMQYKLNADARGKYKPFTLKAKEVSETIGVAVTSIVKGSPRKYRLKHKYDISVKDNCSYLAGSKTNGVIIHNSPETTTGGRALAYFSTLRFAVNKVKDKASALFDDQGKYIAHTIRVRNVKNSVGSPELEGTFMLHYGADMKGPDNMSALIGLAIEKGMIEKGGGGNYRINFNGQTHTFKGEVALIAGIRANSAILEWLISVLNLDKVYIDDILGANTTEFEHTEVNNVESKPKTK